MRNTEKVLRRIDWEQLRAQKEWLVSLNHEAADGLVHLLDALQDAAHDDQLAAAASIYGVSYIQRFQTED